MPRKYFFIALCAVVAFALAPAAFAAEEGSAAKELKVGDKAPDFKLPETSGKDAPKKLSDYKGKKNVVLAFYPKAFTRGCTAQLCGYRDDIQTFKSANTEVIAISVDEQDYSDKFKAEHKFPFTVLGDIEAGVVKQYGVGREGRNGNLMASRSVFVINKEGRISYINAKYSVTEGQAPLFAALKKLDQDHGQHQHGAHEHGHGKEHGDS